MSKPNNHRERRSNSVFSGVSKSTSASGRRRRNTNMTMATKTTTTRPPARSNHSHRPSSKASTTPLGPPMRVAASVGQNYPPSTGMPLFPTTGQYADIRTPSPNYFGLEPTPDPRVSQFSPPTSSIHSFGAATPTPVNANPEFEAFRKRTESENGFNLSHGSLSHFASTPSTGPRIPKLDVDRSQSRQSQSITGSNFTSREHQSARNGTGEGTGVGSNNRQPTTSEPSFFDIPRQQSPVSMIPSNPTLSHIDERHARLSLPQHKAKSPSPLPTAPKRVPQGRADTLPVSLDDGPSMLPPSQLRSMLDGLPATRILVLDLRVFPQYSKSRITRALNLCIPTTLLKRPTFNLQKLTDTFSKESERARFSKWREAEFIVVYDSSSTQKKDALSAVNTLKKFTTEEGWTGKSYILQGGFVKFAEEYPDLIDEQSSQTGPSSSINLTMGSAAPGALPVVGGCEMPATKNALNPFYSNIRQNQDLIGGVGQLSVTLPESLKEDDQNVPIWLKIATAKKDHGKKVSDKFLQIEKDEQQRMNTALTFGAKHGTVSGAECDTIQIAGIEKGVKNRYNNIWPYEHARVKLQGCDDGACDYVNASHVKAVRSNKRYIASQGPLPATFSDFWSVIWDQDVRVIVMLTAEKEGGQLKCHPYWSSNTHGRYELTLISEKKVSLDPTRHRTDRRDSGNSAQRSRASTIVGAAPPPAAAPAEQPHAIVRKLGLKDTSNAFVPIREITQIHYSSWPDFGAPASPSQLLHLVELSNRAQNAANGEPKTYSSEPENNHDARPMLVHCSAGCGRTGTFCTVDSVIDMLKRQNKEASGGVEAMDVSEDDEGDYMGKGQRSKEVGDDWIFDRKTDLVEATVEDFRSQRLSMVQSLRQYVLCYETVLEWIARETQRHDPSSRPGRGRSGSDGGLSQRTTSL